MRVMASMSTSDSGRMVTSGASTGMRSSAKRPRVSGRKYHISGGAGAGPGQRRGNAGAATGQGRDLPKSLLRRPPAGANVAVIEGVESGAPPQALRTGAPTPRGLGHSLLLFSTPPSSDTPMSQPRPTTAAESSPAAPVRLEIKDGAAWITLDRPPLNVLDIAANRALAACIRSLAPRPEARVVALLGAGTRAFSAGVDISDHVPARVGEMLEAFHG